MYINQDLELIDIIDKSLEISNVLIEEPKKMKKTKKKLKKIKKLLTYGKSLEEIDEEVKIL